MAPGAELREVAKEELATLAPLIERVIHETLDVAVGEVLSGELAAAAATYHPGLDLFLAAVADGRTVGGLVMTHTGAGVGATSLVSWLVVEPCHGHRGLGSQLLSRAVAASREHGAPAIEARALAASPAGPRLLWRLGFRAAELSPVAFGGRTRELLVFRLPLAPARLSATLASQTHRPAESDPVPAGAAPSRA